MNATHCKTILCALFLLFSSIYSVFSQTAIVDSLEARLANHATVDTAKVNLLNKLAVALYRTDVQKAKFYVGQSQQMALKLNYHKGQAAALYALGLIATQTDSKIALDYFEQALRIAEKANDKNDICNYLMAIGNVSKELGDVKTSDKAFDRALKISSTLDNKTFQIKLLYNMSQSLSSKGQYVQAVETFRQVVDLADLMGNNDMISRCYSSMASIFNLQGNGTLAMEYYLYALRICEQHNDKRGTFNCLINMAGVLLEQNENQAALAKINQAYVIAKQINNSGMIAVCLTNLGNVYQQMKSDKALGYYQEALQIIGGNKAAHKVNLLINIGTIYLEQNKLVEAQTHFTEALQIAQHAQLKVAQGQTLLQLGSLYSAKKQYAGAIGYVNRALQIANEIEYRQLKNDAHKLLSKIYAATGDYKKAYISHIEFKKQNDSIFDEKNVRKIALLESAYKYDKQKQIYDLDKANQQIKIKNQRNVIFLLVAVTLLVFVLLYQLYISNRLKHKTLRLEIDSVNNQLQYSKKEMVTATLKLIQSSESDAYSMKMLNEIEHGTDEDRAQNVRALVSYYKNKSVYSNWKEFEVLFLKVNGDFYDKLNERFPTLTLNERKLCVFLKLSMNSKDIANITFQSEEALKKARMRLRKKLDLDHDCNLGAFIQSI